ncbi:uncharacterized protein TNCV_2063111 [Trichonephila clavipes]|nr:uncharacterized protein TNCV_2063111 [Trichonephila clavipes]
MKNAVSGRTKTDLSTLYDKLEGKLRSLESLGRTQEKYGDFLTPLVESCLPGEILMAWERKRNTETDAKGSRTLEHLMTFLRLEVQGGEMVQLAKSGFGTPIRKRDSPTERIKLTELMTASALASSVKSSGVNLIELIPDILDRFRIYPVGIVADIEKAFLMLSVAPKDRDYLRFFSPCNEKQLVYRHCRVVFGVSSSPYLLNASIMHLLENCNSECKEVAQKLKSSFYVDNCVTGVFSADEIEIFIEKTKLIMSEGCFNLRIFESNVVSKSVDKHSSETLVHT